MLAVGAAGAVSRFAASSLADNYLKLCHNPLKDLQRWMDEDPRFRGEKLQRRERIFSTKGEGGDVSKGTAVVVAEAGRVRGKSLPELRGGLDAHRQGRRAVDDLPARQGAGVVRNDGLRQVRAEARTGELRSTTAKDRGLADFAGAGFRAFAATQEARRQPAERAARTEQQGRAFVALAHVVADAGGGGWPESMTRELQGCATPQERQAWAVKWGAYLSGQVERDRRGPPQRPAAGGASPTGGLSC